MKDLKRGVMVNFLDTVLSAEEALDVTPFSRKNLSHHHHHHPVYFVNCYFLESQFSCKILFTMSLPMLSEPLNLLPTICNLIYELWCSQLEFNKRTYWTMKILYWNGKHWFSEQWTAFDDNCTSLAWILIYHYMFILSLN